MTDTKQYDLTILGGGPGGYVAAIRACQLGMKVALVEADRLGGICLNWGCIPTKALLHSAELYTLFKKGSQFGFKTEGLSFDFKKIIGQSRKVAERLNRGVEFLMKKNGVEVYPNELPFSLIEKDFSKVRGN